MPGRVSDLGAAQTVATKSRLHAHSDIDDRKTACTTDCIPQVSIILPTWNRERFLAEAIQSVLAQTLRSFELLVVDDGSTDRTSHIADNFAHIDSRVRVIRRPHCGISHALNAGIREARGRYIARMDSDDIAFPCRLERQVAYLESHPDCVLVGCDAEVINEEGEPLGVVSHPRTHAEIRRMLIDGEGVPFVHPTVVMRTQTLLAVGGYATHSFPSEDLELWLRLIDLGMSANIPERLLRYRRHANTVCAHEGHRQGMNGLVILNVARVRWGLTELRRRVDHRHRSATAAYHNECARLALKAGRRKQTLRHARAGITAEPLWLQPYVALAACFLPTRVMLFLRQCRIRIQRTGF